MKAILKYPGGKWRIAEKIISIFPEHKVYLEPFFGSGAVFFKKEPSYIETINDIDGQIVNLFRVCREQPDELARLLNLTPFSREEFVNCYEETETKFLKSLKEAGIDASIVKLPPKLQIAMHRKFLLEEVKE